MPIKGAIVLILLLTCAVGYLLLGWIGILGGLLTVGILSAGHYLKPFVRFRQAEGNLDAKQTRICAEFIDRLHIGRRWRDAQALERNARMEALRAKAHLLRTCQDTYGAQRCCLEIISQTEKEDPLFIEACDLYMSTISTGPRRMSDSLQRISSSPCYIGSRPVPAAANVIPFPLTADRN